MLKVFQQLNKFIELNSAIKFQVLALEHHVITERSACGILPSAAQRQLLIRFRILQMIAFGFNQNHFSRFLPLRTIHRSRDISMRRTVWQSSCRAPTDRLSSHCSLGMSYITARSLGCKWGQTHCSKQGKAGPTLLFACCGRRPQSPLNA